MNMVFRNVYEDALRADAYAKLKLHNTYYLAYRDLPAIISKHVEGTRALDFGCGTGRSSRFLRELGFTVTGVDISADMARRARAIDPRGDYRIVDEGDLSQFEKHTFDLALSAFTFDNVPTKGKKIKMLLGLKRVLKDEGVLINLVSSPEIYRYEWASFSTKGFPENRHAKSGNRVRIIVTDLEDKRPIEDVVCSDEDYRAVFRIAGLEVLEVVEPLGKDNEPFEWINEDRIPPWIIYVLRRNRVGG